MTKHPYSHTHPHPSPEQSTPSIHNHHQKIDTSSLNQLIKAKERFKMFLKTLGKLKDTQIRESIADGCYFGQRKIKKIDCQIKYGFIIKALEARIQKMWRTRKIKKNWGEEDIIILIWIVSKLSQLHNIDRPQHQFGQHHWTYLSSLIPGTTPSACKFRWLNLKTTTLTHRHWNKQEELLLKQIVQEHHLSQHTTIKDWKAISEELYNRNKSGEKCYRNAKQCKEHWSCYLSPVLKKGPWTLQQDLSLLNNISQNKGGKRWCELVKQLSGRTQNAIKNRFTLLIQKQRKFNKYKYMSEGDLIQSILSKNKDFLNFHQQQCQEDSIQPFSRQQMSKSLIESKEQITVQRMDFEQFKVGSLNYCLLEPGMLNASYQFIKLEDICKQRITSSDKLQEDSKMRQFCLGESLSMIFDHCFN